MGAPKSAEAEEEGSKEEEVAEEARLSTTRAEEGLTEDAEGGREVEWRDSTDPRRLMSSSSSSREAPGRLALPGLLLLLEEEEEGRAACAEAEAEWGRERAERTRETSPDVSNEACILSRLSGPSSPEAMSPSSVGPVPRAEAGREAEEEEEKEVAGPPSRLSLSGP